MCILLMYAKKFVYIILPINNKTSLYFSFYLIFNDLLLVQPDTADASTTNTIIASIKEEIKNIIGNSAASSSIESTQQIISNLPTLLTKFPSVDPQTILNVIYNC